MIIEVEGIVMRRTKYGEGSLIADILTAEYEILTLITSGLSSKKGQYKSVLLQVGTPVNCILYYKEGRNMHRLKDISSGYVLEQMEKGSVLLFMIELSRNALGKSGSEAAHYHLILNEIKSLDQGEKELRYFPLQFTLKLSDLLGFGPNLKTYSDKAYFDLLNGIFEIDIPPHPHYMSKAQSSKFYNLCKLVEKGSPINVELSKKGVGYLAQEASVFRTLSVEENIMAVLEMTSLSKKERKELLDQMMDYFRLHIENFKKPNAQDILSSVFDS